MITFYCDSKWRRKSPSLPAAYTSLKKKKKRKPMESNMVMTCCPSLKAGYDLDTNSSFSNSSPCHSGKKIPNNELYSSTVKGHFRNNSNYWWGCSVAGGDVVYTLTSSLVCYLFFLFSQTEPTGIEKYLFVDSFIAQDTVFHISGNQLQFVLLFMCIAKQQ